MKVSGKIVRKRAYFDSEDVNVDSIVFLEIDNGIEVNGDKIKIIPVLAEEILIPQKVGDNVELEGEIIYREIITPSGKKNSSPVPTLRLDKVDKVS